MPAASEVKKIDQSWESKATDISTGNLWGDLEQINRAILDCNEAVTDAGLGGISYVSQNSEIQRRMNAIGIMEEYVMGIRSALQQQLDDPLFDGFNKKATETLSRIHPEKFETANTLGLTVTLGASGHGESYSSKETKDHLDLYDFLGYTVGNYSEYGCLHTESMECVQDFADMFKADYDAVSKSGALKGSSVKSLDDYLKNLVSGGNFSHHMDQPFKSFLSGLLDITIVKPIIDACTGYDCVTGEDLSNTEQSLDLLFAAVSLIPFAGVAGKAIDIGGKEGALFLGKRVAVDCVSYATSYSALKLAEQKGLDPRANILISLGIGLITTKGVAKLVFKETPKAVLNDTENFQSEDERKYDAWNKLRSEGLDLERENDLLLANKGLRPEPSTYLSRDYINEHLAQFKNGVSIVMTQRNYEEFVLGKTYIGYTDNTQFVLPKSLCDEISTRAKGNIAEYERSLGFDAGYFEKGGGLIRVDIDDISNQDLRIPSGNETGANSHWKPGGFTDGGVPEVISDLIPNIPSKIKITEINIK